MNAGSPAVSYGACNTALTDASMTVVTVALALVKAAAALKVTAAPKHRPRRK